MLSSLAVADACLTDLEQPEWMERAHVQTWVGFYLASLCSYSSCFLEIVPSVIGTETIRSSR